MRRWTVLTVLVCLGPLGALAESNAVPAAVEETVEEPLPPPKHKLPPNKPVETCPECEAKDKELAELRKEKAALERRVKRMDDTFRVLQARIEAARKFAVRILSTVDQ